MSQPVVHFEIIGRDPAGLRAFYQALFGWEFQVADASTPTVSEPGQYGFVRGAATQNGFGINGGVAGGPSFAPHTLFYVGVPDVEVALHEAERLGGVRQFGPEGDPGTIIVGQFTDPEGNLIGVAGPR